MKEALKLELEAWKNAAIRLGEELSSVGPDGYYDMTAQQWLDWAMEQEPRGKNSLAQPEQEPVAWGVFEGNLHDMFFIKAEAVEMAHLKGSHAEVRPLYTTPQKRPWVGLTDEDIALIDWESLATKKDCARAIEAKLKEKNT